MIATAGETISIPIECTHRVNGVDTLYDPTTLVVSETLSDGSEDAITYGGAGTGDDALIRLDVGSYELRYVVPSGVDSARLRAKTTDTVQSVVWPSKSNELLIRIKPDPRNYADTPAPTP